MELFILYIFKYFLIYNMEKVLCNYCQSSENEIVCKQKDIVHEISNDFFFIVECKNCGLNFTNPRPKKSDIGSYYPKNYSFYKDNTLNKYNEFIVNILSNSLIGIIFMLIPSIHHKLKNYVKPKIQYPIKLKENESFLDIGCGSGSSTHFWGYKESLKKYSNISKNLFGVEPDESSQLKLKDLNINVYADISDINESLKFDIIRMNWSLEHVHDPSKYFRFIYKHLKNNNSKAIISVPNYDGHIYKLDKSNVELPIHLYHFKYKNISDYCFKNSLRIEYFKTFSYSTMYLFSASINQKLNKYKNMSLYAMHKLQKKLNIIDKKNNGNDMIFILKHDI